MPPPPSPSHSSSALPQSLPSTRVPTRSSPRPASPIIQQSSQPLAPIPDSPPSSIPLPLSASLLLTSLPRDTSSALAQAAQELDTVPLKVTIRLHPIGSAPALRQKVFRVSASNRFETVVAFLRRKLRVEAGLGGGDGSDGGGSVFCYVNSVFAPGLDEGVGGLWRCFKTDDQLIVGYSMTPAFG